MSVPARLVDGAAKTSVSEQIRSIRETTDWDAFLPPRAHTLTWRVQQAVKRGADIVLSAAGLLVLSPAFVIIAAVVKLSSRGPVFYEWRVLGRHARPFVGYKFRTMVPDADAVKERYREQNEMTGPVFKMRNDPRVTRPGRWLRRYSLDELPQLWSVLKGDMSLVGPRPPGLDEFVQYEPWQRGKLAVTPGITCLWQVSGRSEINDFERWMELDRQYIREWSLLLDAQILVRTIPAVAAARGAY